MRKRLTSPLGRRFMLANIVQVRRELITGMAEVACSCAIWHRAYQPSGCIA